MQRRFTLIQGGLCDRRIVVDDPAGAAPARWRVHVRRPSAVDAVEVEAWRALAARQSVPDPFADPDYLMPAAQHGAGGVDVALALVWGVRSDGAETLHGLLPLAMPRPVRGADAELWRAPLTRGSAALLDAGLAEPALTAALDHLHAARLGARLRLDGIPADAPLLRGGEGGRLHLAVRRSAPPVPTVQVVAVGPRPPAARTEPEVERITDRRRVRDGVEHFLALDARTSRAPLIADPAAATLVRVVTRLFARRGQVRVELGRRGGEVVSGSVWLGEGNGVAWRSAGPCEARPRPRETVDILASLGDAAGSGSPGLRLVGSAERERNGRSSV